jgi:hypothetical protein
MGTGHTVTHPFTAVNVHMSAIRCTLDADHAQDTYLACHWVKPCSFLKTSWEQGGMNSRMAELTDLVKLQPNLAHHACEDK